MTDRPIGRKPVYIALIAMLLLVIGLLAYLLLRPEDKGASAPAGRDPNAAVGQYEGKTQAEIQAELNRIVEEGMFNISINSTVFMESGGSEAAFRIENVESNRHLMRVEVMLDDTGEVVYTSGLIDPGYYIQSVPLDLVLEKGTYPATAVFTAYDAETETPAGQAAARITIVVQN